MNHTNLFGLKFNNHNQMFILYVAPVWFRRYALRPSLIFLDFYRHRDMLRCINDVFVCFIVFECVLFRSRCWTTESLSICVFNTVSVYMSLLYAPDIDTLAFHDFSDEISLVSSHKTLTVEGDNAMCFIVFRNNNLLFGFFFSSDVCSIAYYI